VTTKGNQGTRSGPPPLAILCGEQIPQRDVARRHRRKSDRSYGAKIQPPPPEGLNLRMQEVKRTGGGLSG
jgi:hypothetical protein